jgi:hypothetical protein
MRRICSSGSVAPPRAALNHELQAVGATDGALRRRIVDTFAFRFAAERMNVTNANRAGLWLVALHAERGS